MPWHIQAVQRPSHAKVEIKFRPKDRTIEVCPLTRNLNSGACPTYISEASYDNMWYNLYSHMTLKNTHGTGTWKLLLHKALTPHLSLQPKRTESLPSLPSFCCCLLYYRPLAYLFRLEYSSLKECPPTLISSPFKAEGTEIKFT